MRDALRFLAVVHDTLDTNFVNVHLSPNSQLIRLESEAADDRVGSNAVVEKQIVIALSPEAAMSRKQPFIEGPAED